MIVLSVVNNKGGVGKTTTVQNIAAALEKFTQGAKVLAVDLDPQGNLSQAFGIYPKEDTLTAGNWILKERSLEEVKQVYRKGSIHIIPSSNKLIVDEIRIHKSSIFPFNLKKVLESKECSYDYVVIDCPPALSVLTKISLVSCHRYYVPLQAEFFSYEGLRAFISYANDITLINPSVELGGVFATRFNPKVNKKFSKNLVSSVGSQLGDKLLDTFIRENSDLYQAQAEGKHIFDYNHSCNGAIDYYNLTKEILSKL